MERHPDRLQRGGAEPIDRAGGHAVVDAGEQRRVTAHVVALLPERGRGPHHQVVRLLEIDLRVSLGQRLYRDRRQIVGANGLQGAPDGAPDRGANGVDDHGFGHGITVLLWERRAGQML